MSGAEEIGQVFGGQDRFGQAFDRHQVQVRDFSPRLDGSQFLPGGRGLEPQGTHRTVKVEVFCQKIRVFRSPRQAASPAMAMR